MMHYKLHLSTGRQNEQPGARLWTGHLSRLLICAALLLGFGGFSGPGEAASPAWQNKVDAWVMQTAGQGPTEFLVFLKDQADLSQAGSLPTKAQKDAYVFQRLTETASRTQGPILAVLQDLAAQNPGKLEYRPYWIANAIWVRGDAAAMQTLARRLDVAHLYADPLVKLDQPQQPAPDLAPNQAQGIEWNIQKVRAPQVWAAGYTGQGVVIGGQDTGYAWEHPALKDKYRGWNGATADHNYNWHDAIHSDSGSCGADSAVPCDPYGHGTHTMGIMVGDDGLGTQIGMAPGARWIGCRNMNSQGKGTPSSYMECYQWFIAPTDLSGNNPRPDLAPDVINNSWSCPVSEGCTDPEILKTAVENVRAAGILTVHSAGNSGSSCSTVSTPAAIYEASFAVGSTDSNDVISTFSSRGPVSVDGSGRLKPNVSAPGDEVYSSVPPNGYAYEGGTSMAAPHVAGLAALLLSAEPGLKGQVGQMETIIEQSAVPLTTGQTCGGVPGSQVPNNTYGWGRIDAWDAVQSLTRRLELAKTPSDLTYDPGQVITYTLQVTYTYPLTPTYHVLITDVVPISTTFVGATLPYTLTGNTVTWELASLSNHQSQSLNLVVQVSPTASDAIWNAFYSASSDEIPTVLGDPVPIYLAKYNFLPLIAR